MQIFFFRINYQWLYIYQFDYFFYMSLMLFFFSYFNWTVEEVVLNFNVHFYCVLGLFNISSFNNNSGGNGKGDNNKKKSVLICWYMKNMFLYIFNKWSKF